MDVVDARKKICPFTKERCYAHNCMLWNPSPITNDGNCGIDEFMGSFGDKNGR